MRSLLHFHLPSIGRCSHRETCRDNLANAIGEWCWFDPTRVLWEEAVKNTPARTGQDAGKATERPIDSKENGTRQPDWPATLDSKSSRSENNENEDKEYLSCIMDWLRLDPDCKRMFDNMTMILAHNERFIGNKSMPLFQQARNEDPELWTLAWSHITAAIYAMQEPIVPFDP